MLLIRRKKPKIEPPRPPELPAPNPDLDLADWSDATLPPVPTRRPRRRAAADRGQSARPWWATRKRS